MIIIKLTLTDHPGRRGWVLLKKYLYGEAPPRGPAPYPFKKVPLWYTFY